jgi:hypothetical protein
MIYISMVSELTKKITRCGKCVYTKRFLRTSRSIKNWSLFQEDNDFL